MTMHTYVHDACPKQWCRYQPPVTHWKGKLDLQLAVDSVSYGFSGGGLPALFLAWDERYRSVVGMGA